MYENRVIEDRGEYCPVCRKYKGHASHICVIPEQTAVPAWVDVAALQAANEIAALPATWSYTRKTSAIQVIVTREMMRLRK